MQAGHPSLGSHNLNLAHSEQMFRPCWPSMLSPAGAYTAGCGQAIHQAPEWRGLSSRCSNALSAARYLQPTSAGMTLADKHIVFRVDASLEAGTGHVMRCLTLADALSELGPSAGLSVVPIQDTLLSLSVPVATTVICLMLCLTRTRRCGDPYCSRRVGLDATRRGMQYRPMAILAGRRPNWLVVSPCPRRPLGGHAAIMSTISW